MPHASRRAAALCFALSTAAAAQKQQGSTMTAAAKISSARSAAPAAISANATIGQMSPDGKMTVLAKGTNGWLCLPDDPSTPGPDPMCVDKVWQQDFFPNYMAKKPLTVTQIGLAYMLIGSSDASNTDPFATKPAAGEKWITGPPHMMVLLPDPKQLDSYSTQANSGAPYVMWKGTPYAHLMVPVKP